MSDVEKQVAAGIAKEKTRESLAVLMVIADVIFGFIVGGITNFTVGVVVMVALMVPIWRYYSRG